MLSTPKAVAGFLLAVAGALADDPGAAVVTPAPSCGGNPCADLVSAVPACATGCIESAASVVGCAHGDYGCECASSHAIQETAILCVVNGCGDQALDVIGAVGNMCSCVTASPTTPCPESTPTSTVAVTPMPTPACPGNECSFPARAEHECVADCMDAALPEFGCSALEDWNCVCDNYRKVSSRAFACAYACGSDKYSAFNGPAAQGCTCLLKECESSSSSSSSIETTTPVPEPPTTTTTTATSTITPAPECPHPCAPSISAVPACATDCIISAASGVGCGDTDYSCRCASSAAIQASAVGCVVGACGIDKALGVVDAVGALCSCVTASPVTACDGTATSTTTSGGAEPPVTTSDADDEPCTTDEPEEETPCPTTPSGFVTETRTVEVTTSVCDDDDVEETASPSASPTCSAGCGGDDGDDGDDGSDGGDDGSDGGDDDGNGDDDDDDDSGSGPAPSSVPSGAPGGDNGGDNGGDDDGGSNPSPTTPPSGGGGSTTTPKPPIATAGASTVVMVGTGCLAAVVAAFVAIL